MKLKLLSVAAIILLSSPAYAAGDHDHSAHSKGKKKFYSHLDVRVHVDRIVDSEEADEEFDELYSHSHLELGVKVSPKFSINSNLKLEGEPAGHAHGHGGEGSESPGGDKVFDDHPLLIEHLTINFDNEHYSIYAGKFNPIVGFDYHKFPGIYGYQVIEGYLIRERIGLGAELNHDADNLGKHTLNLSTFFTDTTALSDSILFQRGHTSKGDGGLSNTEDLSSFAVSLGGDDFYSFTNNIAEGLSYRIGYAKQAAGTGNEQDEVRYSGSLGYQHILSKDFDAKLVTEYMAIDHLGGEAAHDRSYSTLALGINYKNWKLGTSYTYIENDADEEDESHNGHIFQISAGYTFSNGIGLDLGYKRADEENEESDRVGALVTYSYEF